MSKTLVYDDGEFIIEESLTDAGKVYYLSGVDLESNIFFRKFDDAVKTINIIKRGEFGPDEVYHITEKDLGDNVVLDPKFTNRDPLYYQGESGISFSGSIEASLGSIPDDYVEDKYFYVYQPVKESKFIYDPERTATDEFRVTHPIEARRIGKIFSKASERPYGKYKWISK